MAQVEVSDVKEKMQVLHLLISWIRQGTTQPGDITQALKLVKELHTHVTGQDTQRLSRYHPDLRKLLAPYCNHPAPIRSD